MIRKIINILGISAIAAAPLSSQELNGFVEFSIAPKFSQNTIAVAPNGSRAGRYYALGEQRLQLKYEHISDTGELIFKMDFINDNILDKSLLSVRDAYFSTTPIEWMDLKIGRQIQTWGVGDLMFINDVFPKDWISFFSGRNDEYLKAPSDAVRVSVFPEKLGIEALDISLMPFSQPDINPQTEGRFASLNPIFPFMAANGAQVMPIRRTGKAIDDFEIAARLQFRAVSGFTTALYGYRGRWNNPNSMLADFATGRFTPYFAGLQVYGASTRGAALGGILSLEGGYYYSTEDRQGTDPLVENSSLRYLALYERSLRPGLDIGLQYYGELIRDYSEIEKNMQRFFSDPSGRTLMDKDGLRDELRHLFTLRLTQKLKNETLWLTWFSYFSPSDQDFYFRPKIAYEYSDNIRFSLTGNIFGVYSENADRANLRNGLIPDYENTMFGQFKKDANLNFTARYIF